MSTLDIREEYETATVTESVPCGCVEIIQRVFRVSADFSCEEVSKKVVSTNGRNCSDRKCKTNLEVSNAKGLRKTALRNEGNPFAEAFLSGNLNLA